jgi:SAM-dependent methyltransferase
MTGPDAPGGDWEGYWRHVPAGTGRVFWDAPPEDVAARHLPLFTPHLPATPLPLVDLGCGNGTQTAYLAARHPAPVVGVDVSETAISRARALAPDADHRVLDAADPAAVAALHAELGDCHVYVRGLLHQAPPDARPRMAEGIATLLGETGRAFVVEPARAAGAALAALMRRPGGPPPTLAAVFAHGITPADLPDDALPGLLAGAGLTVLAGGALPLATTEQGPDGTPVELPSRWLVAGRAG